MPLSDEQIERYSRQIVLAEIGPRGQERLGSARVAVIGEGVAAGRAVAYLAAAGIGWIAAAPALHVVADAEQPDLTLAPLTAAYDTALDLVVVTAEGIDDVGVRLGQWQTRATSALWIADGRAGACPPCPGCAAAALATPSVPAELGALRSALLGTIVATEGVKAIIGIGTALTGRVVGYDPTTATVTTGDVTARPGCPCKTAAP